MKNCQQGQHVIKKATFENWENVIIADGYDKSVLRFILDQFLQ